MFSRWPTREGVACLLPPIRQRLGENLTYLTWQSGDYSLLPKSECGPRLPESPDLQVGESWEAAHARVG